MKLGEQTKVNTFSATDKQIYLSIAMDAEGDFAISWVKLGNREQVVYFKRINSSGTAQSGETVVDSTEVLEDECFPSIAMTPAGNFVVTWQSKSPGGGDRDVYLQQYNSAGQAIGTKVRVNPIHWGAQSNPSVAIDAAGNFEVVWQSDEAGPDWEVFRRRFEVPTTIQRRFQAEQ